VGFHDGRTQVTGFHFAGDVLGFDGLGNDLHTSEARALEDSEVGMVACSRLDEPGIQRELCSALSRELVRTHAIMRLLGSMTGEARVASFLLDLVRRLGVRLGRPPDELHLRMTRAEIGSYLGLSLETVSRLFTRLEDKGLVAVRKRDIRMLDVPGLEALTRRPVPRPARPFRPRPRWMAIRPGAPLRVDGRAG
jgi:CRP/FNR family transcriptional regulator